MFIVTDLCFCEYTDHGHCGYLDPKTQSVDNDKTLEISAQQALVHARAGADMIAPIWNDGWNYYNTKNCFR